MRKVRWFSILSLVLLPSLVFADVIYLKNGRSISADSAREDGGKVEYQRGEATYGIPAGLVDHIDHSLSAVSGPQPVGTASARMTSDAPGLALSETVPGLDASADVIRDGRVNPEAMAALERGGNPQQLGSAYFAAGRNEYEHGDRDRARYYLQRAAAQLPQSTAILNNYAAVLAQLEQAQEAISVARRSLRIAPSDAEGYYVLGFAFYQAGRAPEAIQVWKRGLGLRPDSNVQALLARAERETTAESNFQQSETGHFQLRYEGASTPAPLRREIEQTLEQEYSQLEAELGIAPQNTISVSLYSDKAFFDVTQAPSWTGALNDGKLRIPIQGLKQVTPALARILKHELAHSFINQASQGRCPQWLNEGIAQLIEPRTLGARGARLAQLYSAHGEVPLQQLQSSFMDYSSDEARLVYDQALAAAEYIRQTYGPGELSLLLERIGEDGSVNSALQSTLHTDYGHLDDEVGRYLISRYGR
jgi:tetratricopeptide (TPR) repeat protein